MGRYVEGGIRSKTMGKLCRARSWDFWFEAEMKCDVCHEGGDAGVPMVEKEVARCCSFGRKPLRIKTDPQKREETNSLIAIRFIRWVLMGDLVFLKHGLEIKNPKGFIFALRAKLDCRAAVSGGASCLESNPKGERASSCRLAPCDLLSLSSCVGHESPILHPRRQGAAPAALSLYLLP